MPIKKTLPLGRATNEGGAANTHVPLASGSPVVAWLNSSKSPAIIAFSTAVSTSSLKLRGVVGEPIEAFQHRPKNGPLRTRA